MCSSHVSTVTKVLAAVVQQILKKFPPPNHYIPSFQLRKTRRLYLYPTPAKLILYAHRNPISFSGIFWNDFAKTLFGVNIAHVPNETMYSLNPAADTK